MGRGPDTQVEIRLLPVPDSDSALCQWPFPCSIRLSRATFHRHLLLFMCVLLCFNCSFLLKRDIKMWTTYTLPSCECSPCGISYRSCFRIGNFTVILERRASEEPATLLCLLGPHWPFALVFTSGFIMLFSGASISIFWGIVPNWACYGVAACAGLALCLLISLGCSNPGIARRISEKPPFTTTRWIYNDQASTWRSTADSYSQEMNVSSTNKDCNSSHFLPYLR